MNKTFLQQVTDQLLDQFGWNGLKNITIVFPMHRAGLFIKQALEQRMMQESISYPVLLPEMLTIDELADKYSTLRPEEEIRAVCRLYTCYRDKTTTRLDIDSFYGWGLQLLKDFSAADMALLDSEKLIRHVSEAGELDNSGVDKDVAERLNKLLGNNGENGSVRKYYQDLWKQLPEIYTAFRTSQQAEGFGTRGAITRQVVENFDALVKNIEGKTFAFVGFNYLLKAEYALMERFLQREQAIFFWDYDPTFDVDEKVYGFIQTYMQKFPNALIQPNETNKKPELNIVACQSSEAQAQYVHEWLQKYHKAGDKTAVVITDESMLEQVVYALPDGEQFQKANITKGYPLKETRIYAAVTEWLTQPENENPDCIIQLGNLIETMAERFMPQQCTEEENWHDILSIEAYYQTMTRLRKLKTLLEDKENVRSLVQKPKTLRNLVKRNLESVLIPFHGEPITDIQIIGVLETRLLDFDNVLILNAEEGIVPGTGHDNSFIPYDIRRIHQMQTREEESKIYAYNFFRLLRRGKHVTMTFSDAFTKDGKKSMSRFLMQLLTTPSYAKQISTYRLMERAERNAAEYQQRESLAEIPVSLSPSAICDYIECEREFYLKHILKIQEPEQESDMYQPNTFGTLVHGTLEQVYRNITKKQEHTPAHITITKEDIQTFLDDTPNGLKNALNAAYKEAEESYRSHHPKCQTTPYISEKHEPENVVILEMVTRVLQRDMATAPLTSIGMEKWVEKDGLHGRIDRLDIITEQGRNYLRILDYKTGGYNKEKLSADSISTLFTKPEKRFILQTLLYCKMVSDSGLNTEELPLMPQLLFPRSIDGDPHIFIDKRPVTDYADCQDEFESRLADLLKEIRAKKEFAPAPKDKCENSKCYCPFHLLCGRKKADFTF